jgi:hypothetical protein
MTPALLVALCAGCGDKKSKPAGEDDSTGDVDDAAAVAEFDAGPRLAGVSLHGQAPREATQLEIADGSIWVSDGTSTYRYPSSGGDGRVFRPGGADVGHVALGARSFFTIDPANADIRRVDVESGTVEVLGRSPTLATPAGIYRAGEDLVWATKAGVYRMPAAGGTPSRVSKIWARGPLAVVGDEIVLSNGSELLALGLKGGRERRLADESKRLGGLVVADDRVYWRAGPRVASVPLAGGDVFEHTTDAGDAGWIAAGQGHVYWLENPGDAQAVIKRSAADGAVEDVLRGPIGAGAAAVGEDRLYFASAWDGDAALVSRPLD